MPEATQPGSGILVNARVLTLDSDAPSANAIAWADGALVAVGDRVDAEEAAPAGARVFDAGGAVAMPGLVDTHIHPFHGTLQTRGVDLGDAYRLDQVRSALRSERERVGAAEWVVGHTARYDPFRETGVTAEAIDEATHGGPALLNFFDGHTALANRSALDQAGLTGPREFVENAEVVCDEQGTPTGALLELGAMNLVRDVVPDLTDEEKLDAFTETFRALNAVGLTGAHVMIGAPPLLDVCRALEARGDLTARIVVPMHLDPSLEHEECEHRARFGEESGRLWRSGTAKFFLDGVFENGTAWQVDPGPEGVNAKPFWEDLDRYGELVRRFTQAGFSCITHAVGDGAVRGTLDAYETAGPPRRGMHRVEHIETLLDEDLPRFAALGIAAAMQPLHMAGLDRPDLPSAWLEGLAPGREQRGFRTADIARSGAVLALGSDWMVADFDPRVGMAWAQLRRAPGSPDNTPYLPAQGLSARRVLHGYTTCAAAVTGDQAVTGKLRVGHRADITVFSDDPTEVPPDDLVHTPVQLTVVDGRAVYTGPDLDHA